MSPPTRRLLDHNELQCKERPLSPVPPSPTHSTVSSAPAPPPAANVLRRLVGLRHPLPPPYRVSPRVLGRVTKISVRDDPHAVQTELQFRLEGARAGVGLESGEGSRASASAPSRPPAPPSRTCARRRLTLPLFPSLPPPSSSLLLFDNPPPPPPPPTIISIEEDDVGGYLTMVTSSNLRMVSFVEESSLGGTSASSPSLCALLIRSVLSRPTPPPPSLFFATFHPPPLLLSGLQCFHLTVFLCLQLLSQLTPAGVDSPPPLSLFLHGKGFKDRYRRLQEDRR